MKAKRDGQIETVGRGGMSATADVSIAYSLLSRLEDVEAERRGEKVEDVRPSIARRVGTSISTLANIRRMRRKSIPGWLTANIRAQLISVLQQEVQAFEHEINIHLQASGGVADDALFQAQAQLAAAKALLRGAVK